MKQSYSLTSLKDHMVPSLDSANDLIIKIEGCIKNKKYVPLKEALQELIQLLKQVNEYYSTEYKPTQFDEDPTPYIGDLITLISEPKLSAYFWRNHNNKEEGKYLIATALHLLLDLLVLKSYNMPSVSLCPKNGNENLLDVFEPFRPCHPLRWHFTYELDCCEQMIKMFIEKPSIVKRLTDITKSAVNKSVSELVNIVIDLAKELPKFWQVEVTFIRQLTYIAKKSIVHLKKLQEYTDVRCIDNQDLSCTLCDNRFIM